MKKIQLDTCHTQVAGLFKEKKILSTWSQFHLIVDMIKIIKQKFRSILQHFTLLLAKCENKKNCFFKYSLQSKIRQE